MEKERSKEDIWSAASLDMLHDTPLKDAVKRLVEAYRGVCFEAFKGMIVKTGAGAGKEDLVNDIYDRLTKMNIDSFCLSEIEDPELKKMIVDHVMSVHVLVRKIVKPFYESVVGRVVTDSELHALQPLYYDDW